MAETNDPRLMNEQPRIHPTAQLKGVKLGKYAEVGERVILRDVTVGDFSYLERHSEGIYADIGRFCSIAANVRINALEHPMERLTMHKVSYRPNEYFRFQGIDNGFRARRQAKRVRIGHDVWIGHGAVIMPAVEIGHGAVIGANAVVTRSVEPYMIVAGSPARMIRPRFPQAIATRLLELAWWDWPLDSIFEAIPDIQSLSIEDFLAKWEGHRPGS
ncbi:antibiotic acetyltransferase [Phyllobacterium sp. BT25]|uniref:Antibiotic acetyltransferase n=1 Tax=Phyllobacterium pellucidum TaxID=2740464 RepID=A0A849VV75_9HYPH|nr:MULTISPECIES: DapH/DapD/GlmU-related protein [Phyllobacterium]NTS31753.1 antibiotic acetyltransferase [Phyllobacterium pellucidum]SFJ02133.1 phosphonate metabolim protein, transferase hexapeptide repeat family [Phyllobacterium sp. CL33Tsu]